MYQTFFALFLVYSLSSISIKISIFAHQKNKNNEQR